MLLFPWCCLVVLFVLVVATQQAEESARVASVMSTMIVRVGCVPGGHALCFGLLPVRASPSPAHAVTLGSTSHIMQDIRAQLDARRDLLTRHIKLVTELHHALGGPRVSMDVPEHATWLKRLWGRLFAALYGMAWARLVQVADWLTHLSQRPWSTHILKTKSTGSWPSAHCGWAVAFRCEPTDVKRWRCVWWGWLARSQCPVRVFFFWLCGVACGRAMTQPATFGAVGCWR